MASWEKFGEFDSAEEINKTAEGLKNEGDKESLKTLAVENGLDPEDAVDYADGCMEKFCNTLSAALGKIKVEAEALKGEGIFTDWVDYIKNLASEQEEIAKAIRTKEKTLTGCVGQILAWAFKHQWTVPNEIVKAAGVSAGRCTLGEPNMFTAKKIIRDYYLGGEK